MNYAQWQLVLAFMIFVVKYMTRGEKSDGNAERDSLLTRLDGAQQRGLE